MFWIALAVILLCWSTVSHVFVLFDEAGVLPYTCVFG